MITDELFKKLLVARHNEHAALKLHLSKFESVHTLVAVGE